MPKELGSRACFDNPSVRQKSDFIGNFPGETHFVSNENKIPAFGTKLLNHFQDFGGHLRIQGRGGFVEKKQFGANGNGAGNGDPLALTTGERCRFFAGMLFQLEPGEEIHGRLLRTSRRQSMNFFEGERDITQRREMREKIVSLKDGADRAPVGTERCFRELKPLPVDFDGARCGTLQPGKDAQERGFSPTGRANEGQGMNLVEVEVDVAEDNMLSVTFGQSGNAKFHSDASFPATASKVKWEVLE